MQKTIIASKWVYKIKQEKKGTVRYKSRIVLKGYMQVPSVDYTERYSPVANNTTTRLMIAFTLMNISKQ